jgi:hypothetical protein
MSEDQNNHVDSNIPLLRTMKKRGKASSSMFSFRPTRSMSTSKSLRKPRAVAGQKVESNEVKIQKES